MSKQYPKYLPELRFPIFDQEWDRHMLVDLIELIDSGWSPNCEERPAPLGEWGVLKTTCTVWDGYSDLENKKLPSSLKPRPDMEVESGDILITRAGPSDRVGVVVFVAKTRPLLMISDKLIRIRANSATHGEFVSRVLSSDRSQRYLHARKSGLAKAQVNISQKILRSMPLIIPSIEEQHKIAEFLEAVDGRLGALRRKRELLTEYKRGVMQKLFSQEIRFRRDDGRPYPDWDLVKLGDISQILRGSGLSKSSLSNQGQYDCILYGELFRTYDEVIHSVISKTNVEEGAISQAGDILMPTSDVTPDGLATASVLMRSGVRLGGDINIIRLISNVDSVFLGYLLNTLKKNIMRLVTGTTIKHIYARDIKGLELSLPSEYEEQQKIADFLTTIDNKITAVDQQIEQIESFKKGLLQQMFV